MSGSWAFIDLDANRDRLSERHQALLATFAPDGVLSEPVTRVRILQAGLMWVMPHCYVHRLTWTGSKVKDARILFAGTQVIRYMGEATGRSFTEIEAHTGLKTTYIARLIGNCHLKNAPLLGEGDLRHFGRERVMALSLVMPMTAPDGSANEVLVCNDYSAVRSVE